MISINQKRGYVFFNKDSININIKASEYTFKQNRGMLKNITALLYTYYFHISLNALRPIFLNICNFPFLRSPNIGKIRVKVGPKTNYFSYFMSSCTDWIVVFNNFFHLCLANPESNKTVPAIFFFSTIFNCFHAKYAFKARRIIAIKNE